MTLAHSKEPTLQKKRVFAVRSQCAAAAAVHGVAHWGCGGGVVDVVVQGGGRLYQGFQRWTLAQPMWLAQCSAAQPHVADLCITYATMPAQHMWPHQLVALDTVGQGT